MPKFIPIILMAILVLTLTGCATPARISGTIVSYETIQDPANAYLRDSIRIGQVTGGQDTNPMWTYQVDAVSFRAALERSLEQAGLYNNAELADHY